MRPVFNPLNSELNPICHLLALLGAHRILHFSRIMFNITFSLSTNYLLLIPIELSQFYMELNKARRVSSIVEVIM